ncbi:protein SHQ1 homolog [Mugil cephalus]|uniref:protein SHQ1 homolog n=1 Tax=Mugil cephalus TaxID=48193 RepID=UPI001FB7B7EC|nr:protein SHQ1 homolog [Mugil cephalus]
MITPAFDLSQEPDYLILSIRVPYTRTSEFDLFIDGTDFKFYAKPYFLRLTLPGRIVEDGRETAKFDIDKGLFTVRVPKETAGEHFEGLQMLTSLLAPKGSRSAKPLVEDVSAGCGESAADDEEEDEEEFDWQVEQEVYMERSEEELRGLQKYGFGNQRSGVFARLQEELSDVIDVKNPEGTSAAERRQARLEAEASAFSPDHYLADLFEDDEVKRLLKFRPWWTKLSPPTEKKKEEEGEEGEGECAVSFTDDEKEQLRKFTNRSYLLDKASRYQAWLGLVDVLLAYSYEVRSTEGEHSVESPWTIRKLSGTLCWLETYTSLHEVLVSFGRRVLCYPLYRHFGLVSAAVRDTTKILLSGKAGVLKCLLDIHKVFRENDPAYILNDLYLTDYCVWIQRVKSRKVTALGATLKKTSLEKKDLELELDELELAATMVVEEEEEEEEEEVEEEVVGEQRDSRIAPVSYGDSSRSSSSDSSDESEESEAEGQGCAESKEGGGGGGGGGGETFKDNPPQPQPTSSSPSPSPSPIPHQPTSTFFSAEERKVDARPSRQLIQELGDQVAEELRISPPDSSLGKQLDEAAAGSAEGTSGRTFLELSPRRNPLLIVQTQEDLHDPETDFIS